MLLGKSGCLRTGKARALDLVAKHTWQSLQAWAAICVSLRSSWQLVSTASRASVVPELHCASSAEQRAWVQEIRGLF